jgi:glutathione S-transferase
MVLKLYATDISPPSRFVGLVLLEKKVPFELVNVDLVKGEQKSAANTANQPFGQIPYIVSVSP